MPRRSGAGALHLWQGTRASPCSLEEWLQRARQASAQTELARSQGDTCPASHGPCLVVGEGPAENGAATWD